MRHTSASHLIKAGVDIRVLAEVFGWRPLQMAMRYGHVLTGQALAAIDTINGLGMGRKKKGLGDRAQGTGKKKQKIKKEGRAVRRRKHRPDRVTACGEGRTAD